MNTLFGLTRETVVSKHAHYTVEEILRQPTVWKSIYEKIAGRRDEIKKFIGKIDKKTRIILTGAGSSGFVADALAPVIRKELGFTQVESIHTTDIVASPHQYLVAEAKTLLISFGRSGNSPESIAAIQLAEQLIQDVRHIVITCNNQGELAGFANERTLNFQFDEANDQGFAMTSSVTGMLLAAYGILNIEQDLSTMVNKVASYAGEILRNKHQTIADTYQPQVDRLIVLGAGNLFGAAREAALKLLELTAGKVISRYDTPMGFRHGPKAMLTPRTVILYFVAGNDYTKRYDLDMLRELSQASKNKLIVVSDVYDEVIEQVADVYIFNSVSDDVAEAFSPFIPLIVGQLFALSASLRLGCTPDNPFPGGEVNKIVQGVIVHPIEGIH
ncbi:SIS domain-containing protein [Propionispora vibrioides]|uniref:Galactosamine 6-phosphate isomerase AgaS n=1 Tax=Propionispora vibrioides TaxID=112903 RepID=A0A1H8XGC5_9FIRM|nr:SIS domain-containing protein [Propionispora vibrioides]SEP38965.1 galactosamine 6-phosphate isomerase AgaS [Propionispora vibrioides]